MTLSLAECASVATSGTVVPHKEDGTLDQCEVVTTPAGSQRASANRRRVVIKFLFVMIVLVGSLSVMAVWFAVREHQRLLDFVPLFVAYTACSLCKCV